MDALKESIGWEIKLWSPLLVLTISKTEEKLDLLNLHSEPAFNMAPSQKVSKNNYIMHDFSL